MNALIIAISGVTCGGKTTLANELKRLIPESVILSQDNYFLDIDDPRHIWCEYINHIPFDVITSLDMKRMLDDIIKEIGNCQLLQLEELKDCAKTSQIHPGSLRSCIDDLLKNKKVRLIILEGFLLFAHKPLLPLVQLKYFFTLDQEECSKRRNVRIYDPPDVPGYFEKCVWPEYLKHLQEVKTNVTNVTYFDSSVNNPLDIVLMDIYKYLK